MCSCHNSCLGHSCTIDRCHWGMKGRGLGGAVGAWRGRGRWTWGRLASLDSCRVSCRLALSARRWACRASRGGAATTLLLRWTRRRLVLPRPAARQVPAFHELRVINHPEGAEIVFVSDEALVQRQIGADGVLHGVVVQGRWGVGSGFDRWWRKRCEEKVIWGGKVYSQKDFVWRKRVLMLEKVFFIHLC